MHLPCGEKPEHEDFHFAMDLSKEMRQEGRSEGSTVASGAGAASFAKKLPVAQKPSRGRGRPPGGGGRGAASGSGTGSAKGGQAKLAFGRQA